eukprot:m.85363 g.85363  ORF g.85363 m.85363 type:complete len:59 (+) comp25867_c0_seq1:1597-1773(+)
MSSWDRVTIIVQLVVEFHLTILGEGTLLANSFDENSEVSTKPFETKTKKTNLVVDGAT